MSGSILVVDDVSYAAAPVNVVFLGTKAGGSIVQTVPLPAAPVTLEHNTDATIKEIIVQAACERFLLDPKDVENPVLDHLLDQQMTIHRTTALVLCDT